MCPLRNSHAFRSLSGEELSFIERFKTGEFKVSAGTRIFEEGAKSAYLYTVLQGWAVRFKALPDGRRQILNFALPGDFLGLQAALFAEIEHGVETLTPVTLCVFEKARFMELYRDHGQLAFDVTWLAARQERLLDGSLLSLGRRSAQARIAEILLRLYDRLERIGLVGGSEMDLPLTQQHLADALGLSLVHTNKSLKKLSDRGLIAWRTGVCRLEDRAALEALADYTKSPGAALPLV